MNEDTIRTAAEEYAKSNAPAGFEPSYSFSLDVGAHWMQAQKDEQIKELVEALIASLNMISGFQDKDPNSIRKCRELIQKYKG